MKRWHWLVITTVIISGVVVLGVWGVSRASAQPGSGRSGGRTIVNTRQEPGGRVVYYSDGSVETILDEITIYGDPGR